MYIASAIVNVVAVDDYTVATRFLLTMARVKGPFKVHYELVGFFRIQLLDEKWRQPARRSIRRINSFGNLRGSYQILLLPVAQVSGVITNVMFPAFSAIQKDVERVKDMYLKSISVISLVTFPLTLGLLVVSQSFVLAFFGDKWAEMIPILLVFCLLGLIQSIGTTVGWIYQSQGRTDIMFRWGLVSGSIFIISFVVGLRWGALGVAVAYTVANFLLWYPSLLIPGRLKDLHVVTMLRRLAPTFCGAATMRLPFWYSV